MIGLYKKGYELPQTSKLTFQQSDYLSRPFKEHPTTNKRCKNKLAIMFVSNINRILKSNDRDQ